MLITHTKMVEQLNLELELHRLVFVRYMRADFYDDAGNKSSVLWNQFQRDETGVDLYQVMVVINGKQHTKEWYSAGGRDESLALYRESVLVHEENTLGDNAHPR